MQELASAPDRAQPASAEPSTAVESVEKNAEQPSSAKSNVLDMIRRLERERNEK